MPNALIFAIGFVIAALSPAPWWAVVLALWIAGNLASGDEHHG